MAFIVDLEADLRRYIMNTLPYDVNNAVLKAELGSKNIASLAIIFFNWSSRLVGVRPRRVHLSNEFQSNPLKDNFEAAIAEIMEDIQTGKSLTGRLSKEIVEFGYVEGSHSSSKDKDLMLNDWGIHHLHLGMGPDPKDSRFVKRTKELLLVMFKSDDAYVLDIVDHNSWTSKHIVRAAIKNWPDAHLFPELVGVLPSNKQFDASEHAELHKAGITIPLELDGKVYTPPGIMSTAGTNFHATKSAARLLQDLRHFEEFCKNEPDKLQTLFEEYGVPWPNSPAFELRFSHTEYFVIEQNTGLKVTIMSNVG
jgi:hypothetical protein